MIHVTYDPRNKLSDLQAFLDSYTVDFSIDGKTYYRAPVQFCNSGPRTTERLTKDSQLFSIVNVAMVLKLVQYEPYKEDDDVRHTRWPFYVHEEFSVMFLYKDQWWKYSFAPGKLYEERVV